MERNQGEGIIRGGKGVMRLCAQKGFELEVRKVKRVQGNILGAKHLGMWGLEFAQVVH